jgi:RNA polymerase sigma-70 factor (ECF subfamily)
VAGPEARALPASDPSLIERARSGDQAAFQALVGPLIDPGYQLAIAMLRQREAAEDAVQEATIRAWRKFTQVRQGTTSLRPWFLAIVANECRTVRRGRWWAVIRLPEVVPPATAPAEDRSAAADLRRSLERLRHDDRLLLHLHYWLDLPLEEVAAVLGTTAGAAKARRRRLLRRLRLDLDPEEVS